MSLTRRVMPSLAELTAFEAVARRGSITSAAEELALTQGAVSKQIGQLEETVGVRLFDRVRQRLVITHIGRLYAHEIRSALWKLEHSTSSLIAASVRRNVLSCAVLPSFAARWLAPRLPRFAQMYPTLTVNWKSKLEPFSFDEEAVDLAIHYGQPNWLEAVSTRLMGETIVPVASPAYRAQLAIAAPTDIARATLIQAATRPAQWRMWFDQLAIPIDQPFQGPVFDQFLVIIEAAAAGLGVGLLPHFIVEGELASGRLVALAKPIESSDAYYIVVPTAKVRDALVEAFSDWLLSEVEAG